MIANRPRFVSNQAVLLPVDSMELSGTIRNGRQSLSMLMTSDRSARTQLPA
jgi:hypothetical protein